MPVDYSKFKDLVDSDEEPVWETQTGKSYKGLPQKVITALDDAAKKLPGRKCYCFLDFTTSPEKFKDYETELMQTAGEIPASCELGRVIVELDQAAHAPKLCENFRSLCTGERGTGVGGNRLHYKGRSLDLILPRFCLQASIPNEYSCWGTYLPDERLRIPGVSFDRPGLIAVGNHGPNTNTCTFMITMHTVEHLNGYNQIIGRVVQGMEVLRNIELFPTDRTERSFAEKNVKTWWGGKPLVDVVIANCGELPAEAVDFSAPSDGDIYPEHPLDCSPDKDHDTLFNAQEKLREIGNKYFKEKKFQEALLKYRKAQDYLGPLLKQQHLDEFGEDDPTTWMSGGHRPKDRTPVQRAKYAIRLNVCQVLIAQEDWLGAIAIADDVLLELVGKNSKKGMGALPNDALVIKALFRRARARVGLSQVPGEVSQLEEAIEDLKKALTVDDKNVEVRRELEKVRALQREADAAGKKVYETMLQPHDEGKER